ncbi:MAG: hemin uptake protein HemP [Boseongicola sp.]|nr:hemin uptake protein HemP [Boseongicola sp.]
MVVSASELAQVAVVPPSDTPPLHEAKELTNGGVLARIKLEDQLYFLRITRAGKLILTK